MPDVTKHKPGIKMMSTFCASMGGYISLFSLFTSSVVFINRDNDCIQPKKIIRTREMQENGGKSLASKQNMSLHVCSCCINSVYLWACNKVNNRRQNIIFFLQFRGNRKQYVFTVCFAIQLSQVCCFKPFDQTFRCCPTLETGIPAFIKQHTNKWQQKD